jgi:broad specificity phosphatase PhoE
MKLLFVRHAESMGNASGEYSTAEADSLSPQGEGQAQALATCLSSWRFDKIIVSPRQRALETITPYLAGTDQQAEIWPEIAEACWHDEREAPSACWHPQPAELPDAECFRYRDNEAIKPAFPESFGEGLCRVHATMDRLRDDVDVPESRMDDGILQSAN